ncbi:hypothetical protein II582_03245 [bacterium]|nr:hypothetical protein [bacterium]
MSIKKTAVLPAIFFILLNDANYSSFFSSSFASSLFSSTGSSFTTTFSFFSITSGFSAFTLTAISHLISLYKKGTTKSHIVVIFFFILKK